MQWLISDLTPFLHTSLQAFPEVLSKALPSTKSEVALIPVNLVLDSPLKEARQEKESRIAFCRPSSQASKEKQQGKQRDGTWPYLLSVTKMPRSFSRLLARQDQTSSPTKLQSVKKNVCGRDSLCLEFGFSHYTGS